MTNVENCIEELDEWLFNRLDKLMINNSIGHNEMPFFVYTHEKVVIPNTLYINLTRLYKVYMFNKTKINETKLIPMLFEHISNILIKHEIQYVVFFGNEYELQNGEYKRVEIQTCVKNLK